MSETELANNPSGRVSPQEKHSEDANNVERAEDSSSSESNEGEYPTGIRMVVVVAALMIAIFLSSLDLVSKHCPYMS